VDTLSSRLFHASSVLVVVASPIFETTIASSSGYGHFFPRGASGIL
jgi:hypothetical protein